MVQIHIYRHITVFTEIYIKNDTPSELLNTPDVATKTFLGILS